MFGTLKSRPFGWRGHELVEEPGEARGRDAGSRIGGAVVEHDGIALYGHAGRKDDVRDLAVELVFLLGDEERRIGAADDAGGILEIEQRGLDREERRTAPVIADIGIEDEPAVLCLDRRSTEFYLIILMTRELERVLVEGFVPTLPAWLIPEIFDLREGCKSNFCWRTVGIWGHKRVVFSPDLLWEKCHGFGIERRDEMTLVNFFHIFRESDGSLDTFGSEWKF